MSKVMLINVTHAEESRVAIMADGTLISFEIESFNREHLKGNIYKGVIHRIHPALEAAFVDIGADRDAFLPLDEICFRHLASPPPRNGGNGERRRPRIQDILKPGQEVLVQIVKEQFGSKPPTLSTFYSLPGRYLVLLPGSDDAGISRRIEGADRVRVRELIEKLRPPEGYGIIVRTVAGFDPGVNDLQRDMTYLLRLWESIQQAGASKRAPALVYREHDLVLRNIRDYFTPDIDEIHVDNEDVFLRAREFLRDVMPEKESALRLYQGDKPIFSHFNVEAQIESIYKRRVPLKSGGYVVIDGTEALTAIDVNSGRSIRGASQEETAFRTNIEAAVEIARQLRLRDQGGLIVIDFIDMRNPQHIGEVEKALRTAMFEDKARHEAGRISHFGLLEVSRQRLRPAAAATSYVACPMCDGHGLVRTTESAALVALRKVHNRIAQGDVASLRVALPNDVAMYLLNQKREDLAQLERRYATKIQVAMRAELMPHQAEIETKPRIEGSTEEQPQLRLGGVAMSQPAPAAAEPEAADAAGAAAPAAEAVTNGASPAAAQTARDGKRRRRRGRRRGRGKQAAAALGEALSALAAHTSAGSAGPEEAVIDNEAPEAEDFADAHEGTLDAAAEERGAAHRRDEVSAETQRSAVVGDTDAAGPTADVTGTTADTATVPTETLPPSGAKRSRRGRGGAGRGAAKRGSSTGRGRGGRGKKTASETGAAATASTSAPAAVQTAPPPGAARPKRSSRATKSTGAAPRPRRSPRKKTERPSQPTED